ncbi:MAG: hypothetical protein NTZ43_04345 [Gemmatimonadetes bacterium]|nr:hypothetical protein [Gemmatimonadota bacterium]
MASVPNIRQFAAGVLTATLAVTALYASACASQSSASAGVAPTPAVNMSTAAPSPDPRVGLKAGTLAKLPADTTRRMVSTPAAEASWNMRLVKNVLPVGPFVGVTHSDLAFRGNYVVQGNYDGYEIFDISNPRDPKLFHQEVCRGSQSDVSVYGNLIFVSGEAPSGRLDCGLAGIPDSVSKDRFRGIRIFDATDLKHPKYIQSVQTCRGSHTHTVVEDLNDKANVYIYVSGSAGVRSPTELPGCSDLDPALDPNSELFKIEIIQVPLANPVAAHVVTKAPILADLGRAPQNSGRSASDSTDRAAQAAARGGRAGGRGGAAPAAGRGGRGAVPANRGPVQCHDITVYPASGFAGGACGGYGVLLDIRDAAHPVRLYAAADSNMSFWHSATFSNDGTKVLFSDEWGGGSAPRCRVTDHYEWGADALFNIVNKKTLAFTSYYKMPAAQTSAENCVAHNGSLVPIPGRDVMIQAWYQGGVSLLDWTDNAHPKEIAFMDRGPIDTSSAGASGGSWSVYWYNGYMYSSEIARGLDVFELQPSAFISQNEIDAAKTVKFEYLNVQGQQKLVWPASFALSRSYVDQLERSKGYSADKLSSIRAELSAAEKLSGQARKDALSKLSTQLHGDARGSSDAPKAHTLASAIGDLAK